MEPKITLYFSPLSRAARSVIVSALPQFLGASGENYAWKGHNFTCGCGTPEQVAEALRPGWGRRYLAFIDTIAASQAEEAQWAAICEGLQVTEQTGDEIEDKLLVASIGAHLFDTFRAEHFDFDKWEWKTCGRNLQASALWFAERNPRVQVVSCKDGHLLTSVLLVFPEVTVDPEDGIEHKATCLHISQAEVQPVLMTFDNGQLLEFVKALTPGAS